MFYPLSLILLAFHAAATPLTAHARDNSVAITSLEKNVTSTSGIGNVAAAGKLAPFNDIGIGCGINWQNEVSYGGGLQAGSVDFGLGSGFTVTPDTITIGAGIGLNSANASANIQFTGSKNGSIELVFESSRTIFCVPETTNQKSKVTCHVV